MLGKSLSLELKVGLFAIFGILLTAVMVFTLEGLPWGDKYVTFYTEMDNVGGVGLRTQVRTSGVNIGKVVRLEVKERGVRVYFDIEEKVKIPKGSTVKIKSQGILGTVFLEIERNLSASENLDPNSLIPKRHNSAGMDQIMGSVGDVAVNLKDITASLREVFASEEGKQSLKDILKNVNQSTANINDLIRDHKQDISETLTEIRNTIGRISEIVQRNDGRVDDLLISLNEASKKFEDLGTSLNEIADENLKNKVRGIVDGVQASIEDLKVSAERVNSITEKVDKIVAGVEKGEGTVGKLLKDEETVEKINTALDGVNSFLSPVTNLVIDFDYKFEVRSGSNYHAKKIGNHVNLFIRPNKNKYYIIGVSDSQGEFELSRKRTVTTNNNGVEEVHTEEFTPHEKSKLRFNAQFAKRWDWFTLRFGLMESTAGVGADAYFFKDSLVTTAEIFEFGTYPDFEGASKDDTSGAARVKLYGSWFFTDNLYFTGGVDYLGKKPSPLGFFGMGINFTDDDLKSLFSTVGTASSLSN